MTAPYPTTIDEVEYVRTDSLISDDTSVRIVVLQRGWVAVGRYVEDGDDVTIYNGKIIRRWGTTRGLGELVNGPGEDTVLDLAGTIRTHRLGVMFTIDCNAKAWESHL